MFCCPQIPAIKTILKPEHTSNDTPSHILEDRLATVKMLTFLKPDLMLKKKRGKEVIFQPPKDKIEIFETLLNIYRKNSDDIVLFKNIINLDENIIHTFESS